MNPDVQILTPADVLHALACVGLIVALIRVGVGAR